MIEVSYLRLFVKFQSTLMVSLKREKRASLDIGVRNSMQNCLRATRRYIEEVREQLRENEEKQVTTSFCEEAKFFKFFFEINAVKNVK